MAAAQGALGDGVALVSIDVDQNESAQTLARHANNGNLDWTFAIAPVPMQRALSAQFGRNVLNPPAGNLIVIDRGGNPTYLPPGVKPSDELVRIVAQYQ